MQKEFLITVKKGKQGGEKNPVQNAAIKTFSTSMSLKGQKSEKQSGIKNLAIYIIVARVRRESRLIVHCNTLISTVSRLLTFDLHYIQSWVIKHLNYRS